MQDTTEYAVLLSGFITAPFQSESVKVSVRKHMQIVLAEFKLDSMSNLNQWNAQEKN